MAWLAGGGGADAGIPGGRPRSDPPAGESGGRRQPRRAARPAAALAALGRVALGALLALSVSLGELGCERRPNAIELSFAVAGEPLGEHFFGPRLDGASGYWLYDPETRRTQVHLSGRDGSWRVGLDLALPLSGLGRYRADASYRGIDRAFQLSAYDGRARRHFSLVAVDAEVALDEYDPATGVLGGRFQGRFAVGSRTSGVDILSQPEAERRYVEVSQGRFRLPFRDTLSGRGRLWPTPSPVRG